LEENEPVRREEERERTESKHVDFESTNQKVKVSACLDDEREREREREMQKEKKVCVGGKEGLTGESACKSTKDECSWRERERVKVIG
jgi:hypothetical protein